MISRRAASSRCVSLIGIRRSRPSRCPLSLCTRNTDRLGLPDVGCLKGLVQPRASRLDASGWLGCSGPPQLDSRNVSTRATDPGSISLLLERPLRFPDARRDARAEEAEVSCVPGV